MIAKPEAERDAVKVSTLGIVAETTLDYSDKCIYSNSAFGPIVDALARLYSRVLLCTPTTFGRKGHFSDCQVSMTNVELIPQPAYRSSLEALRHPVLIGRAYARTLRCVDHVFVRGMLPYAGLFYLLARRYGRSPVHWIVGDPIALLRSHRRSGVFKDTLGMVYAYQDRFFNRIGRRVTGGAFVCNGEELARIYSSSRTRAVVSTALTENDFFSRDDTCNEDLIRLLFVGYVRPEKGLEYLIEALPKIRNPRPWRLSIVGSWDGYQEYKSKLDTLIATLGLGDRIDWTGHVSYGHELWVYFRRHDVFILPTLSEGTPHVLVEARANSLPIVATRVGGIPTSVTDGVDGILVPPKDPEKIAQAINRIIDDGVLRRSLINMGLVSARRMTVGNFVADVASLL